MSTAHRRKNLLKIPDGIRAQVESSSSDHWLVECVLKVSNRSIRAGHWRHLGLESGATGLVVPDEAIPRTGTGRYSRYNCHGREIKHKDLPMHTVCWSVEAPNFPPSTGTHEVEFCKKAYQRSYWPPRFLTIRVGRLGEDIGADAQVVRFTVNEVLDRHQQYFDDRLLYNLNLLQENVRAHGVYPSDATREDYLATLYVDWQILPPGQSDETVAKIIEVMHVEGNPRLQEAVRDRHGFLETLKPQEYVVGTDSFQRYFGAKYADDLVAFENLEYGNALYIMYGDWRHLCQRSRVELLASPEARFERVIHRNGWKKRAGQVIHDEMRKRGLH